MEQLTWQTEKRKVDDLLPHPNNPRTLSEKQTKDLTDSLKKFGLAEIPVINTDNTILAGHQRLKIMQILGRGQEEIDVRTPNRELTKEEADEYLIRSNKNTGSWDFDGLANNWDVPFLTDIGFSLDELKIPPLDLAEQEEPAKKKDKEEMNPPLHTCPSCGHQYHEES